MTHTKQIRFYTKTLKANGASNIEIVRQRKHPVLRFEINGKPCQMTISGTPSDQRGERNNLSRIRRLCREAA